MESELVSLYLRLFHTDWLPPVLFSRLVVRAGSLAKLLTSSDDELLIYGLAPTQIQRLRCLTSTAAPEKVHAD